MSIVSDSSPIIGLHNIGHLDLLRVLFRHTVIPPAVAYEVQGVTLPDWITLFRSSNRFRIAFCNQRSDAVKLKPSAWLWKSSQSILFSTTALPASWRQVTAFTSSGFLAFYSLPKT